MREGIVDNGKYGYLTTDENGDISFEEVGRMPEYIEFDCDLETKNTAYTFKFTNQIGVTNTCTMKASELFAGQNAPQKLIDAGVDLSQGQLKCFRESLKWLEEQNRFPFIFTYTHVGFLDIKMFARKDSGKEAKKAKKRTACTIFRSNKLILPPGIQNVQADYKGGYDLREGGTAKDSFQLYKDEVVPYTKLLVAFLCGVSAMLTGYIEGIRDFTNPILHLWGNSSTGKSCAAKLICSVFGRPFEGSVSYKKMERKSVYGSWSGTENAIRDQCTGNCGIPIILNEIGKSHIKNLSSLLYDLAEGTTKQRSNQDYNVNLGMGYHTAFVSTGEFSIFDRIKKQKGEDQCEGLRYRILELCTPFTENAAHAKRIEEGCQRNYGHGANVLAAYMLKLGKDKVLQMYDKWNQSFSKEAGYTTGSSARFINTYAAPILTTAELVNKAWKIDIDMKALRKYLMEILHSREKSPDWVRESFDLVVEQCIRNTAKFRSEGELKPLSSEYEKEIWGVMHVARQADQSLTFEIWLYKSALQEICEKNSLPPALKCVKEWAKENWTVVNEKDRLLQRRKNRSYYILKINGAIPTEILKRLKQGRNSTMVPDMTDEEEDDGTID